MNTYIDGQETEKEIKKEISDTKGIFEDKKTEKKNKTRQCARFERKKPDSNISKNGFSIRKIISRIRMNIFHFPEPDDVDDVVDWTDAWVCRTFAAAAVVVSWKWPLSDDSIVVDDGIRLVAWVWQVPRAGDGVCWRDKFDDSGWRKLKQRIVSSCELETIWNSSNWSRKTRPVCSVNVFIQSEEVWERGSSAAWRSQILILPEKYKCILSD